MDIKFRYLPDSPPVFDAAKARARFAAAKADYLAGGTGPEVCERHGISLRTFRWRASKEGWRRADQPAPSLAPDPAPTPEPAPEPAPTAQDQPLVIPDAPTGASRDAPPLTAAQMAAKAWSHVQAAIAAGRQIEARGWLRIHKELQPHIHAEETAERLARMDREAAERRARGEPEPEVDMTGPLPTRALDTLHAELTALTRLARAAAPEGDAGPQLHCFSPSACNTPASSSPSPSGSTGGSRHTDGAQPRPEPSASLDSPVRPGNDGDTDDIAPPLHRFSRSECNTPGPAP